MKLSVLGIRHHGAGSAKHVLQSLKELKPDLILVEGAPEIAPLLQFAANPEMKLPLAIMVYNSENSKQFTFYPFTHYSPEWIAAKFATENNIALRTMDLPAAYLIDKTALQEANETLDNPQISNENAMQQIANISGYAHFEPWWDYYFENTNNKKENAKHFEAVETCFIEIRKNEIEDDLENSIREAFMRTEVQKAKNELFQNVVIICGAWHCEAFDNWESKTKADSKLLKSIPKSKIKIATSWVPWTNSRLSMYSGYGAGIEAPGWYEHIFENADLVEIKWLIKAARLFRKQKIEISSAHIIETYRLAEALAALRNKSRITFDDLNESILSVMCMGDEVLFSLIKPQLFINERIGTLPPDTPRLPIQIDFETTVKKLRLPMAEYDKEVILDLRKELDLQKSIFFYRMLILENSWLTILEKNSKGTFKEAWNLCWKPEVLIELIDKAYLGNTIESAAKNYIFYKINQSQKLSELTDILSLLIPAELYTAIEPTLDRINEIATLSAEITDLIYSLGPLIQLSRYGNVRNTDVNQIAHLIELIITKINAGLYNACYGLDEEQSRQMNDCINFHHKNILLIETIEKTEQWQDLLKQMQAKENLPLIIIGNISRILFDANLYGEEEAKSMLQYFVSTTVNTKDTAHWIDGFLHNSAEILLYDETLWNLIYDWVAAIPYDDFLLLLPFVRKTFSNFEYGQRREIAQKVKSGKVNSGANALQKFEENSEEGKLMLEVVAQFMGLGHGDA